MISFLYPRRVKLKLFFVSICSIVVGIICVLNCLHFMIITRENTQKEIVSKFHDFIDKPKWKGFENSNYELPMSDREKKSHPKLTLVSDKSLKTRAEFHNSDPFNSELDDYSLHFNPYQSCSFPRMNINEPNMILKVKNPKEPSCNTGHPSWVSVCNGSILFAPEVIHLTTNFTCDYTPLLKIGRKAAKRKGESSLIWGGTVNNISNGFIFPHDIFRIDCEAMLALTNGLKAPHRFSQIYHGVSRKIKSLWQYFQPPAIPDEKTLESITKPRLLTKDQRNIPPSVMVLGFNSISRMSWVRRMRKVRQFFIHNMQGVELKGYNVIGDHSSDAINRVLAGQYGEKVELGNKSLDGLPWLWDHFAKHGYVTSWAFDGGPSREVMKTTNDRYVYNL